MRNFVIILLCIVSLSCGREKEKGQKGKADLKKPEKFEALPFNGLNIKLSEETELLSPKAIMRLYYPRTKEKLEKNERIIINEKNLSNGHTEVILIHDGLADDSMQGKKYVLELKKHDKHWQVISLKANWRCWEDKGHSDWGVVLCH